MAANNKARFQKGRDQEFSTYTKEEIYEHRKNKFLAIGKQKSFVDFLTSDQAITKNYNSLKSLSFNFLKNKKNLFLSFVVLLLLIIIFDKFL